MRFVATLCMIFIVAAAILFEVIDLVMRLVDGRDRANFAGYWYEVGFGIWIIVVGIGGGVAYLKRKLPPGAFLRPTNITEVVVSRLIVSEIFQATVIVATTVFALTFLFHDELLGYYDSLRDYHIPLAVISPLVALAVVLLFLRRKQLRAGLDIAMDVVNHFLEPKKDFPIRKSISTRFYQDIDDLTRDSDRPHLLIIAHSQGSVIAVDALANGMWRRKFPDGSTLESRVASMTILSFGSPLTHIYQHYFPHDYGPLAKTALMDLALDPRVKWLNIFRSDDYVGTHIDGPMENFPINIRMPKGGHLKYWCKNVLGSKEISAHLPGEDRVEVEHAKARCCDCRSVDRCTG